MVNKGARDVDNECYYKDQSMMQEVCLNRHNQDGEDPHRDYRRIQPSEDRRHSVKRSKNENTWLRVRE